MVEVKQIPTGGKREKYTNKYVALLLIVCVSVLVAIIIGMSKETFEQVKWLLTFGFSVSGGALGLFTASENVAKQSYAYLNK